MNSLKSSCSFAKSTPVPIHQFEKDVEPFLGSQARIKLVVSLFGILKTAEYLNDSRHALDFTTPAATSTTAFALVTRSSCSRARRVQVRDC